jgi:hypothetical protein
MKIFNIFGKRCTANWSNDKDDPWWHSECVQNGKSFENYHWFTILSCELAEDKSRALVVTIGKFQCSVNYKEGIVIE